MHTISCDPVAAELTREIIKDAGRPNGPEQLGDIEAIKAAMHKYWWCVDTQDWEMARDVYATPFESYYNGRPGATSIDSQVASQQRACDDTMVPMHMGHNAIIKFIDDKTALGLFRLNDYHTYKDDGETYEGWGQYVNEFVKGDDGVWRIRILRLTYRKVLGSLRSFR